MYLSQRATGQVFRRGLGGAATAAVVGSTALLLAQPASAVPDPCAASSIARTVGSVGTNTGIYLDAHPDTNQALTTISQQQAGPQSLVSLKAYFEGNPQAGQDLQAIQQPLTTLSAKCKLPVSLPQLLGLLQAAQQSGGLPAGLPGTATAAQAVAGTTGTAPVVGAPVTAVPTTPGSASGPAATGTR